MTTSTPMRICFVAHTAFGEMSGRGNLGGIQRQQSFMARWLAARGHVVSMLVWDEGQADELMIDGVRVIKICRRAAGIPGLRFVHPRWTALVRALRRADAQVYYHNTSEYVTGQVAEWCRLNRRAFVFSVANDRDVLRDQLALRSIRERLFYSYGLRHSDRLIAQTLTQRDLIQRNFGLESQVIPMPCARTATAFARWRNGAPPHVMWAGRFVRVKRLELLLDLAEACPDVTFDVAGEPSVDEPYHRQLLERARAVPNVVLHGRVSWDRMSPLYSGSSMLVCTSSYEGFPNTFLEAWSHGLPLVTSFDPDGIVAREDLGGYASDVPGLAAHIRRLLGSEELWTRCSTNALRYYEDNHTPEVAMERFEAVFLDAARS
jgi:glycosyltransferase involved in cell wall biosynthesis